MRDKTRDQLEDDARGAGIAEPESYATKGDLEEALESRAPAELGPVIPEGVEPPAPKASGSPTVGVQPLTDEDIPEAGR